MRDSPTYWRTEAKKLFDQAEKKGNPGLTDPYYLYCLKHLERIEKGKILPTFEENKLKDQLEQKIESARYLSCSRKGAWGRRTMADEKRDIEINKLKTKIQLLF